MTEERCEWSDLIKAHCAHCLGHEDPVVDALVQSKEEWRWSGRDERPPHIVARYVRPCPECQGLVSAGDPLILSSGHYVCVECES